MIDFVVTGCGRSGTGYASRIWTQLGLTCGHEALFNAAALRNEEMPDLDEAENYCADSSWVATGILQRALVAFDRIKILHQVRNPVHVIRSLMGTRFFERTGPYTEYARLHLRDHIRDHDEPLVCCMKYWAEWNRLAESLVRHHPVHTYRVEALTASLLRKYAVWATSADISEGECEEVLETTSKLTNSRKRDESITWESLPEGIDKISIHALAMFYGYTNEELQQA